MEISLAAETVFHLGPIPVTNSMLMSLFAALLLILLVYLLQKLPKTSLFYNFFEMVIEWFYNLAIQILGEEKKVKKIFPIAATLFLFIITNNWLGLLPGVGTIGFWHQRGEEKLLVPLLRSGNADLNSTLGLAISAIFIIHYLAAKEAGVFNHLKKFFNLKGIFSFVGILELFSELSKILSFSFRLFGNIFAGEVLLMVVSFLIPFFAPLPFLGLEIFVGFIQALVFTTLTLVFYGMATSHQEEN